MKVDVAHDGGILLREVFRGVLMETQDGHAIGVCMRDDTFEINVTPKGFTKNSWWRVDMQKGTIYRMFAEEN